MLFRDQPKPVWDELLEVWTVPITCPCCRQCRLIVRGKGAGKCVQGGPYKGYLDIPDAPDYGPPAGSPGGHTVS